MTGLQELIENTMVQARDMLKQNHAVLMRARLEFEAIEAGHSLKLERRQELMKTLERWDDERRWFLVDNMGGVSLFEVCEAAGTKVDVVRAFYQDLLDLPFNFRLMYHRLWELRNVGEECRVCPSSRCEEAPGDCAEGGTPWERVARSDSPFVSGADSFCRTEEDRWAEAEEANRHREVTS